MKTVTREEKFFSALSSPNDTLPKPITRVEMLLDKAVNYIKDIGGIVDVESYAISAWTPLASSSPYTYKATVTATYTIGNDTTVELINDQAVLFAKYGFAIGEISGQTVTIYSIGVPDINVTLEVEYRG